MPKDGSNLSLAKIVGKVFHGIGSDDANVVVATGILPETLPRKYKSYRGEWGPRGPEEIVLFDERESGLRLNGLLSQ